MYRRIVGYCAVLALSAAVLSAGTPGKVPGAKAAAVAPAGPLSGKKVLFVVAPQRFRDEEYLQPQSILSAAGAETVIASTVRGELKGILGCTVKSDVLLKTVRTADYAGLVFVGGDGGRVYYTDPDAQRVAREAAAQGKVLGAICVGPVTLAKAGVLKGIKVTVAPDDVSALKGSGARYTGRAVEQDGLLITATGPAVAREFGQRLLSALSK